MMEREHDRQLLQVETRPRSSFLDMQRRGFAGILPSVWAVRIVTSGICLNKRLHDGDDKGKQSGVSSVEAKTVVNK